MCNHGISCYEFSNLKCVDSNFVRSVSGLQISQGIVKSQSHYPPCLVDHIELFARVRTGPGNPGKSLNLKNKNQGLESPGILLKVLESPEILNSEKLKSLQKWYLL